MTHAEAVLDQALQDGRLAGDDLVLAAAESRSAWTTAREAGRRQAAALVDIGHAGRRHGKLFRMISEENPVALEAARAAPLDVALALTLVLARDPRALLGALTLRSETDREKPGSGPPVSGLARGLALGHPLFGDPLLLDEKDEADEGVHRHGSEQREHGLGRPDAVLDENAQRKDNAVAGKDHRQGQTRGHDPVACEESAVALPHPLSPVEQGHRP